MTDKERHADAALRVFLDTSVLIASALSDRGTARALTKMIGSGRCDGYVSPYVLDETRRNLMQKAPAAALELNGVLAQLSLSLSIPTDALILQVAQSVEVKDAPVVAAALAAGVDALVTFDKKHLLNCAPEIEAAFGLAVVDPGVILAWLTPKLP
ncbi:MAG: PIN domain-containing protein [Thermomicrobiales bacterium]